MDQLPTLQQLEYLESGFEISKILAHAGFFNGESGFLNNMGTNRRRDRSHPV